MAYITIAELKLWLKITNTDDDTLLTGLINDCQAILEKRTMRLFAASVDSTEKFDSWLDVNRTIARPDLRRELLFTRRTLELAAVPTTVTNGDGEVLTENTHWVPMAQHSGQIWGLKLLVSSGKSWQATDAGDSENAISIVGKWGYSTAAGYEVKRLLTMMSAYLYRLRTSAGSGDSDRVVRVEGGVMMPSRWPRDVTDGIKLLRYKGTYYE